MSTDFIILRNNNFIIMKYMKYYVEIGTYARKERI